MRAKLEARAGMSYCSAAFALHGDGDPRGLCDAGIWCRFFFGARGRLVGIGFPTIEGVLDERAIRRAVFGSRSARGA